jgi:hypothetical protein
MYHRTLLGMTALIGGRSGHVILVAPAERRISMRNHSLIRSAVAGGTRVRALSASGSPSTVSRRRSRERQCQARQHELAGAPAQHDGQRAQAGEVNQIPMANIEFANC